MLPGGPSGFMPPGSRFGATSRIPFTSGSLVEARSPSSGCSVRPSLRRTFFELLRCPCRGLERAGRLDSSRQQPLVCRGGLRALPASAVTPAPRVLPSRAVRLSRCSRWLRSPPLRAPPYGACFRRRKRCPPPPAPTQSHKPTRGNSPWSSSWAARVALTSSSSRAAPRSFRNLGARRRRACTAAGTR